MHYHYIYLNPEHLENTDDEIMIYVHHLVGYCPQTLEYYKSMAELLKRSFPDIDIKDVGCHHITRSSRVKGFTLVTTGLRLKKEELGLPNCSEWAEMIKKSCPYRNYPVLPDYESNSYQWNIILGQIEYNY